MRKVYFLDTGDWLKAFDLLPCLTVSSPAVVQFSDKGYILEKRSLDKDIFCGCSVHIRVEEKISLTAGRDGGLENFEIHGMATIRISEDKNSKVKVHIANRDNKSIQLQVRLKTDSLLQI